MAKVQTACGGERFPNVLPVVRLCAGMTLLFTSYQEAQNAAPQGIKHAGLGNLGFYALAVFFCALMVGNQVAPSMIHRFGGRTALPIGALAYFFFLASLLIVSHLNHSDGQTASAVMAAEFPIAAISGIVGGVLFPSQQSVLTHYAPPQRLNWYMCFFSLFFFASSFLGPAFVAPVIYFAGKNSLAVPVTLLIIAGLGFVLLCGLPHSDEAPNHSSSSSTSLLSLLGEPPARRLSLLAFAEGWCLNPYVAAMLPVMATNWSTEHEHEHLQLLLLLNGLGHICASLCYAPLADRYGRRFMLIFQAIFCLIALMLGELDLGLFGHLKYLVCDLSAAFFLGFSTVLVRTNNSSIVGSLYRDRAGSAFSMMATLRAFGSISGMLSMPSFAGSWSQETVAASLGCLGAASVYAALHKPLFVEGEVEKGGPERLQVGIC